jgi:transcriptional regulator with XRE-family HTH domain
MSKPVDSPEIVKEMSLRLKRLRTWSGLSQKDFAVTAQIDPQTYSKLELGKHVFSLPTVRHLVISHGVSADWLMAIRDDEPRFEQDTSELRAKVLQAVDHYCRSLPAERAIHPETEDKLKAVPFETILGTVPNWEDIHGMRTILSRYEPPRVVRRG